MITVTNSNKKVTCTTHYEVNEENNCVYLNIKWINYHCKLCDNAAMVDLSLVPIHTISIICLSCEENLLYIKENQFKIELICKLFSD